MKPLRPGKKWVLAAIGLLLALLVLKIVLFLTAKPKITVDYVAEYNRISRPANYDPNDNAAPYYQKAFDVYVAMPDELRKPYINWSTDYNSTEQTLLENWLASNLQTFEYFREAINKPYCWIERISERDGYIGGVLTPDLNQFKRLAEALVWDAKLNAAKGQFQSAFENILECYKAGSHKCRPSLFSTEQYVGLGVKQDAVHNAFIILDKSKVDNKALKFFQSALQAELNEDTYVPDMQRAEKLMLYDALQRTFIDNGKGTGRLAWSVVKDFQTMCGREENLKLMCKLFFSCLFGPTRNQIVQQIETMSTISNQIMTKTPWQIKNEGRDYFEEIAKINNSNFFLQLFGGMIGPTKISFHIYHKTRTQTEALIAVLAILRYKADTGQFSESLDKLVSAGYLQSVPVDPYSDGPLVYKLTEDNFKLYSVGEDFVDDGGSNEVKTDQESIFRWKYVVTPNIVYWPFKDLKKLCYDIIREAKARREIEEANHPE